MHPFLVALSVGILIDLILTALIIMVFYEYSVFDFYLWVQSSVIGFMGLLLVLLFWTFTNHYTFKMVKYYGNRIVIYEKMIEYSNDEEKILYLERYKKKPAEEKYQKYYDMLFGKEE